MDNDFTVEYFRQMLEGWPSNMVLKFEGGLTFSRLKQRDDNLVVMEFSEIQADLTPAFRKKHPEIIAAFCRFESNGEMIQTVYVPSL